MSKKYTYLIITILLGLLYIIYAFDSFVLSPWFGISGLGLDEIKNIYGLVYHSKYEHGVWSQAFNYPYGEHVTYMDALPLLSLFFSNIINVDIGTALTVMWWAIAFNFLLAMVYTYLILNHFNVKPLISVVFSCIIVMFSPQFFRITGHFGLSFVSFIPMLFYWTILYNENEKKKYTIYFLAAGIIFVLLHPYYLAFQIVWFGAYCFWYVILNKKSLINKVNHVLPVISSVIGVILFFTLFMKLSDPIKDRPSSPFVCKGYFTEFANIFSSNRTQISGLLRYCNILPTPEYFDEGYCYIGLVSFLVVVISIFIGVYYNLTSKRENIIISMSYFNPIWICIAITIFIISSGVPFIWHMDWFISDFNPLKTFRSLGRLSWIFYFIISIYAILVINRWYANLYSSKKKPFGIFLVVGCVLVWNFEVMDYARISRKAAQLCKYNYDLVNEIGIKSWESFLMEHKYKKDDFQAVLLWSLINGGTDKYSTVNENLWLTTLGDICCLQLHLPDVFSIVGRSSWGNARKQLKLSAGPFVAKSFLNDIPNKKPFLLLQLKNSKFNPDENYIFDACQYIGEFNDCKVYSFYPDSQLVNDRYWKDSVAKILIHFAGTDTCIGDCSNLYINHLDNGTNKFHYFGTGAFNYPKPRDSVIASIEINKKEDSILYEFSTWFLLNKDDFYSPKIVLLFYNSTGPILDKIYIQAGQSYDNEELWSRASKFFYLPHGCKKIIAYLEKDDFPSFIAYDEIVFKPATAISISKCEGKYMVNNHFFSQKSSKAK